MDRLQAMLYLAATPEVDIRLAAYLAAAHQHGLACGAVSMDLWWAARCQLGALLCDVPEASFAAVLPPPPGTKQRAKKAGAGTFCDPRCAPTAPAFNRAMRRLGIARAGAGMRPHCAETGQAEWRWPEAPLPAAVAKMGGTA